MNYCNNSQQTNKFRQFLFCLPTAAVGVPANGVFKLDFQYSEYNFFRNIFYFKNVKELSHRVSDRIWNEEAVGDINSSRGWIRLAKGVNTEDSLSF